MTDEYFTLQDLFCFYAITELVGAGIIMVSLGESVLFDLWMITMLPLVLITIIGIIGLLSMILSVFFLGNQRFNIINFYGELGSVKLYRRPWAEKEEKV